MSDQEMLELAAKAAGYEVQPNKVLVDADDKTIGVKVRSQWNDRFKWWQPLTDDGDALRLAVKLRIVVDFYERRQKTECACAAWSIVASGGAEHEELGADPYAATRRAIVRAAAEIGKGNRNG